MKFHRRGGRGWRGVLPLVGPAGAVAAFLPTALGGVACRDGRRSVAARAWVVGMVGAVLAVHTASAEEQPTARRASAPQEAGTASCEAQRGPGEAGSASHQPQGAAPPRACLDVVVVTGTRSAHAASDAPVPTQVISRERIEAIATDNIEAVLATVPDLYVRRNEEFSLGASTLRMQGLDANKTAVLLDGRRFRGGIDGVVDLRDIAIGGIEQVEILRGPASSLYGSDAMAGVVNIRTRSGGDVPWLRTEAALGSAERERLAAALGHRLGPLRYFLSAQHDAVAISQLYGSISEQFAGARSDDQQRRSGARLRLDGGTGNHELRFVGDWQRESNPLSFADDASADGGWTWRPAPDWSLEGDAGLYRFTRRNDLEGFGEDLDYVELRSEVRATREALRLFGVDHFLAGGARIRHESLDAAPPSLGGGFEAPGIQADVLHAAPFAQMETFLGERWSLVLGVSADHHAHYGFEASPRATLTWRPREELRWSATWGRGYRAPDLLQLFNVDVNNVVVVGDRVGGYAIVGNPDLRAETDLGATLLVEYRGWRGVGLMVDAFRHDLEDGIGFDVACSSRGNCQPGFTSPVPDLNGPVFTYRNIGAAVTQGIDATVELEPWRWWGPSPHRLDVTLAWGLLDTENRGNIAGERGNDLPFRPRMRVLPSLQYAFEPTRTALRVWGEWNDRQYADLANTDAAKVDAYWLLGARLQQDLGGLLGRWSPTLGSALRDLSLFVQAENLTDEDVAGGTGPLGPLALAPRRNVQVGIRWTLDGHDSSMRPAHHAYGE